MKRICVLILFILILFSGCWQNSNSDKKKHPNMESTLKPVQYIQDGKLVKKSTRAKYLIENNVIYENDVYDFDAKIPAQSAIYCPYITDLEDEKIKTKINNEIKSILKDKIYSILKERTNATIISVDTVQGINVNNLFSLRIKISTHQPSDIVNYYHINLNYNLKNGERIKLKDIFTDGTDYVSLLNEKITEKILKDNLDEEQQRRPFEGIDPDQEFFLDEEQLIIHFSEGNELLSSELLSDEELFSIPYYELEEYMDIFEKFQPQDDRLYASDSYLRKRNNLRIKYENKQVEDEKCILNILYPKIMVSKSKVFADDFNEFMEKHVYEILNNKDFSKNIKSSNADYKPPISIMIEEVFNIDGVVCFRESCFDDYRKVYFYDLNNGKQYDFKKLIIQNKDLCQKVMAVKDSKLVDVYPEETYLKLIYENKYPVGGSKYYEVETYYSDINEDVESFFKKLLKK